MARALLNDLQWQCPSPALQGGPRKGGQPPLQANRVTVEGILWIARNGAPWRDLHPEFGNWNIVQQRFRRWTKTGVFEQLFNNVGGELQLDYEMVDGALTKGCQHGTGTPKGDAPAASQGGAKPLGGAGAGGMPRS